MHSDQPSIIARDHTLLGVCEGLGEDFGFNPVYLRVALALTMLWNPVVPLIVYSALAVPVGLSRLIAPNPRTVAAPAADAPAEADEPVHYAQAA
jgi:phage shock protein PspC (stress-responsive transcriptional regulator)